MALLAALAGCAHTPIDGPYVASLQLRGVHNVSSSALKKGLASRPIEWWKRGPERSFNELELEKDRTRVQRFYEENGYFATHVQHAEGKPRQDSKAVDVLIAVEEGPPTLIGDVKVFGVDALDSKTRHKIQQYQLGLRRGQVFHHADYLHFKESLTRELKKSGYADTEVEGVVDVSPTTNLASIVVKFHPHGVNPATEPAPLTKVEQP